MSISGSTSCAPHPSLPEVGLRKSLLRPLHRRRRQGGRPAVASGKELVHGDPPRHHREAAPRAGLRPDLARTGLRELCEGALLASSLVVLSEVRGRRLQWHRLFVSCPRSGGVLFL